MQEAMANSAAVHAVDRQWIDSTASRTAANTGMAATTAPKPTRLPTVSAPLVQLGSTIQREN
jgi:hypothetical protein